MSYDPIRAADRPTGILCPRCKKPLGVAKTRNTAPGIITRYRVCRTEGCKFRRHVPTEERPRRRVEPTA